MKGKKVAKYLNQHLESIGRRGIGHVLSMELSGEETAVLHLVEFLVACLLQLDLFPPDLLDERDELARGEDLCYDLDVLACDKLKR